MKLDPILKKGGKGQSRGYGLMMMVSILNLILFLIGILAMLAVISRLRQSLEADYGALALGCMQCWSSYPSSTYPGLSCHDCRKHIRRATGKDPGAPAHNEA